MTRAMTKGRREILAFVTRRHDAWQRILAFVDKEPDFDCDDMNLLRNRA